MGSLGKYDDDQDSLVDAVKRFSQKRILVLGDMMLDRFVWGAVSRISPEAPVPVVEVKKETTCLGGAANVSLNIRTLGGNPVPLGVVGGDVEGKELMDGFRALGTSVSGLFVDSSRPTSLKTRIIAQNQQVCRTDREDRSPVSPVVQQRLAERFSALMDKIDAVIISDYGKGLVSPTLLRRILPIAKAAGKIVCVDPKLKSLAAYRPAKVITPNTQETERASEITISSTRHLIRAGRVILSKQGIDNLLVTRGEKGMTLFEGTSRVTHIPTVARDVYDVTGAGDTVISSLALGLVVGLSMLEAAVVSNIAAGIVIGKLGTAAVTPNELVAHIASV